jgi:hypothetical protein
MLGFNDGLKIGGFPGGFLEVSQPRSRNFELFGSALEFFPDLQSLRLAQATS